MIDRSCFAAFAPCFVGGTISVFFTPSVAETFEAALTVVETAVETTVRILFGDAKFAAFSTQNITHISVESGL